MLRCDRSDSLCHFGIFVCLFRDDKNEHKFIHWLNLFISFFYRQDLQCLQVRMDANSFNFPCTVGFLWYFFLGKNVFKSLNKPHNTKTSCVQNNFAQFGSAAINFWENQLFFSNSWRFFLQMRTEKDTSFFEEKKILDLNNGRFFFSSWNFKVVFIKKNGLLAWPSRWINILYVIFDFSTNLKQSGISLPKKKRCWTNSHFTVIFDNFFSSFHWLDIPIFVCLCRHSSIRIRIWPIWRLTLILRIHHRKHKKTG